MLSSERMAARMEWVAEHVPLWTAAPVHEALGRLAEPHEIPEGARRVMKSATDGGWEAVATYAYHELRGAHVLVSLRHPATGYVVAALWQGKTLDCAYTPDGGQLDGVGIRDALTAAGAVACPT